MLGLGRATAGLPVRLHASEILLSTEGTVSLAGRKQAIPLNQAAQQLSLLFSALIGVATGNMPALATAAKRTAQCREIERVLAVITQALIPLNRGAAKRALARLARETVRAKQQGLLELEAAQGQLDRPPTPQPQAIESPPAAKPRATVVEAHGEDPEIVVLDEHDIVIVGEPWSDERLAQAVLASDRPAAPPRSKSVPPPLHPNRASEDLAGPPADVRGNAGLSFNFEPTPTVIDAHVDTHHELQSEPLASHPSAANPQKPVARAHRAAECVVDPNVPDVPSANAAAGSLEEPAVSTIAEEPEEQDAEEQDAEEQDAEDLTELLEPKSARSEEHIADPIALPTLTAPSRLDELLDCFGDSDEESAVGSAASSLKKLAELEPTPPPADIYALTPSVPLSHNASVPSMRISGSPAVNDDDSGAIAPQTILSQRLLASRTPLAVGTTVAGFIAIIASLLFLGDDEAPPAQTSSATPRAATTHVTGCHANLALRDLPSPHEILLKLGDAPFESRAIPTGVRIELVATAPGHQTERIVVPPDADWQPVDGKWIMPLRLSLRQGDEQWWPSAPAARVGGTGPKGFLSVSARAPNTELWLVAGAGQGSRNAVTVRCEDTAELLVVNPTHPYQRKRLRVEPPLLRAAAVTNAGAIPVMPQNNRRLDRPPRL